MGHHPHDEIGQSRHHIPCPNKCKGKPMRRSFAFVWTWRPVCLLAEAQQALAYHG